MKRWILRASAVAVVALGTTALAAPANAADEDSFLVRNVRTGLCLDLPGFGPGRVDGPVLQYHCDGSPNDNQLWRPIWGANGQVAVQNVKDGLCLDLPFFGPVAPGTRVSEYHCNPGDGDNQMFLPDNLGEQRAYLKHVKSGLCLDVDGPGTGGPDAPIQLSPCVEGDDHIWQSELITS